jgi:hypothetical protein
MNMTGFRSQQPLDDDDFAAIRRNVMSTIAARNERRLFPIVMRFAIAAAVIVAIGLALVSRRAATPVATAIKTTKHPEAIASTAPAPVPVPEPAPIVAPVARVVHRPRQHRAAHIELAHQNIRVEFRTSDPDIRIIWIASQTPTPTGGKS